MPTRRTGIAAGATLAVMLAACGTQAGSPSLAQETSSDATFTTGCVSPDDSGELTGAWAADDGGMYSLGQMGGCVWWSGTELEEVGEFEPAAGFANVAVGRISGDEIHLDWEDVRDGSGFGGIAWTRQGAAPDRSANPRESASDSFDPSGSPSASP